MKKFWIGAGILAGLGTIALIGYSYVKKQAKLIQGMCYSFAGYKIIKASLSHIDLEVYIQLTNKSKINLTVTGYDIDVSGNGTNLVKIKNNTLIQNILANGSSTITLSIGFDTKPLIRSIFNIQTILGSIINPESIEFGFKGTLNATALGFQAKNLPIDKTLKLNEMLAGSAKSSACV